MAFNWEATDTYWVVDPKYLMMLVQNYGWDLNGRDAIGRTFIAYFTYGDERFLEGIENCWDKIERKNWLKRFLFGKYYYQGYRYSDHDDKYLSRNHLIYTLLAFKYGGYSEGFIKDFVKHLRFRISKKYLFTLNLWLWARVIANIKPYSILYYPFQWLTLTIFSLWNRLLYEYSGFGEESHQEDFIKIQNSLKPSKMVKLTKKFYSISALHIMSWQIRVLKDSKWKKRLQKIALTICPEHNYVVQLLLQSPNSPSRENVESYRSMEEDRWTGILNSWINDRDINFIKDPKRLEWNVQDVDYLRKLYSTVSCFNI